MTFTEVRIPIRREHLRIRNAYPMMEQDEN